VVTPMEEPQLAVVALCHNVGFAIGLMVVVGTEAVVVCGMETHEVSEPPLTNVNPRLHWHVGPDGMESSVSELGVGVGSSTQLVVRRSHCGGL
jgi:hypothetical protein